MAITSGSCPSSNTANANVSITMSLDYILDWSCGRRKRLDTRRGSWKDYYTIDCRRENAEYQ